MSDGGKALRFLLLEELDKRAAQLAPEQSVEQQRRAVHALKGSAGMAGERPLGEALARIERRIDGGDVGALDDARALCALARAALHAGVPIPLAEWPMPPPELDTASIEPSLRARYIAEAQDRLARLDAALASSADEVAAAGAAYREVHALKGAALAVGDEFTAWFCHGLEERLRAHAAPGEARRALDEASRWRSVLAEAVIAPDGALESLRATTDAPRKSGAPAPRRSRPATPVRATLDEVVETTQMLPPRRAQESDPDLGRALGEATLRVGAGKLERLLERVRRLSQTRSRVDDGARGLRTVAGKSRELRDRLTEALRLIGPPRPWGAPMAAIARIDAAARDLGALADGLDREAIGLSLAADRVRDEAALAHGELVEMRTTTAAVLLERVAAAVIAQARREGVELRVQVRGGETPIERRVADGLFDPMLQLARNAVAHGLEPATERLARGKPSAGTILLAAEPRSGGLRLRVEDDGAGVDVARVRERARSAGAIFAALAETADDPTLLGLLFVPGFSTRDTADLLAGRGVGLDLALEAVRRLGGSIRLSSEPGIGLSAVLDVPLRGGMLRVLWVEAGGASFALPVQQVRRLHSGPGAAAGYPLVDCLRGVPAPAPASAPPRFAAELEVAGGPVPVVGFDAVGDIENVALLAVSPLVLGAGPYAGAVVRGDELRLCVDIDALAEMLAGG